MIIGIDASRANLKHKTGTEWYSFHLIENLATLDHTNKYWLYLNRQPSLELAAAVKDNPNFSFKVLKWPFHIFWTLGRLTLEMLICRPNVLFIPAHTLPLFGPFKTINTIHDLAFIREQNLYRSKKVKTRFGFSEPLINFLIKLFSFGRYSSGSVDYLYWSTAFALRHAKKIIAVSEFTKQEILQLYPKTAPEQIVAIPNGYDDEAYKLLDAPEKNQEILAKYGLETPYFLYVGRLEKKKNTLILVEAFALFKENNPQTKTKLVLVGDASFGYDEVKYAIEEFNLGNQVILPGWVSEEDLPYIFRCAQAFIFPSRHEGFGIPVLQAFACGVPTAVSDIPIFHEIAGDAVIYFDQNDKGSIAAALTKISTEEDLRQKLRAKGLARASEFSWRKCAAETLKLIASL
jgi:glycosyltransferase involved in cell wall biosynthesis